MRYYLQLRDKQIGALLGKPRTTVNYQKNAALKQLRTEMEKMNDEEQQIQPCSLWSDWKSNHRRYRRAPCGIGTTQSLHRQIKRRKRRYARAIKCKAAHGGFEVPTGLSAAEQIAKPWKTVKGQDKRAAPALDGFSCPCYGTIKRAQTDRPLAPSLNYGVFCYAVGAKKAFIHAALQR